MGSGVGMELIVGSVDPGTTSGICVVRYDFSENSLDESDLSTWGILKEVASLESWDQVTGVHYEAGSVIWRNLAERDCDVYVIEDFILYGALGTGHGMSAEREGLDPVRVTSAFMTARHLFSDDTPVVLQMAGQAKNNVTNERLKQAGMWRRGFGTERGEHAADAVRHALHYLRNEMF